MNKQALILLFFFTFASVAEESQKKVLILFSGWSCKDCFHHLDSALKENGIENYEYVICDEGSKTMYNQNASSVRAYSKNKAAVIRTDSVIVPEKRSRKRPSCHLYGKYRIDVTPALLVIKKGDTLYLSYDKLFGEEGLRHEFLDSVLAVYKK